MSSLTYINSSDLTPHIRRILDDITSMTSNILLKRGDIAANQENDTSVKLSTFYNEIVNGTDTLTLYGCNIPKSVYKSVYDWKIIGAEYLDRFPDTFYYGQHEIPMVNKYYKCYIGSSVPEKTFGRLNDGYIHIKDSSMKRISFFIHSDYMTYKINDLTEIEDRYDEVYCLYDPNIDYVPLSSIVVYRKDGDNYIVHDSKQFSNDDEYYYYYVDYDTYLKTYVFENFQIDHFINNEDKVPPEYTEDVLNAMRSYVINTYINPELSPPESFSVMRYFGETNEYYRMLNGLPPVNAMTFQPRIDRLLINPHYKGTNTNPYVYELDDNEISILESNGTLDTLIKTTSNAYLKYLGKNRVDVNMARNTDDFDILRIGTYKDKLNYEMFITYFKTSKNYILKKYYHPELFYDQDYYIEFISCMIILHTMCQCMVRSDSILINNLYSDEESIRNRLKSFGLNVFDDIPLVYRKNIAKYIETLIRNKGCDNIYDLVVSIFNIDNIEIFKYFYRKTIDDNGDKQISMAQVPVNTTNFISEMIKDINKISYDQVTGNDPYWGSYGMPIGKDPDKYLRDIILSASFNYMNSKYISINSIFNLSKLNYNASYLMNYLLDLSRSNINITLPVTDFNDEIPLFYLITALFAIQAIRLKYDGNIQYDPISVAYVLKYNLTGTVNYNGDEISILDLYKKYYSDYYTEDSSDLVKLTIPTDVSLDTISDTYMVNSGLSGVYSKLINMREHAKTYKEYECYANLLKAISVSKMNQNLFRLTNPQWFEMDNFVTWNYIVDDALKRQLIDKYMDGFRVYKDENMTICISHGEPEISLGGELSDKHIYCIDVSTFDLDTYISTENLDDIKIYEKEYAIPDDYESISDSSIGKYHLYIDDKPVDEIDVTNLDVPCYYFDKTEQKLYKYTDLAPTYRDYLKYMYPELYNAIQPFDSEYERDEHDEYVIVNGNKVLNDDYYTKLSTLYTNIIYSIETYMKSDDIKVIINNSMSDLNLVSTYIKKVLNVFKSIEIDIAASNVIYEINDTDRNRIKLIDDVSTSLKETLYDKSTMLDDISTTENSAVVTSFGIRDELIIKGDAING